MNLELKEGLGCWGYIQRKLTYLGSRRARCCLLSTSCTPSTLHMKPLFVTFLQRKQHHRFMVEGKTGFGKVNDVPSSRSLLIKEAEWCSSLEALKGEPLDVDTLSMGFWDYHLRKLLSFCACSILFICKRSCICCLREHENQLCNTSPRAWHTEGIQWVQWLLPLLLSLLLLFSLQGKCRVSHSPYSAHQSLLPEWGAARVWAGVWALNSQAHGGPGLGPSPGRTWGSEVGGEGRGTVTDSGGGLHLIITLLSVAYQCVPESRSGERNPGETGSKYSLVWFLSLGFSEIHSWLPSGWQTATKLGIHARSAEVSWSHKPCRVVGGLVPSPFNVWAVLKRAKSKHNGTFSQGAILWATGLTAKHCTWLHRAVL